MRIYRLEENRVHSSAPDVWAGESANDGSSSEPKGKIMNSGSRLRKKLFP